MIKVCKVSFSSILDLVILFLAILLHLKISMFCCANVLAGSKIGFYFVFGLRYSEPRSMSDLCQGGEKVEITFNAHA